MEVLCLRLNTFRMTIIAPITITVAVSVIAILRVTVVWNLGIVINRWGLWASPC